MQFALMLSETNVGVGIMKMVQSMTVMFLVLTLPLSAGAVSRDGLHLNFEPSMAVPIDEQKENFDNFAGWDLGFRLGYKSSFIQPQLSFSYLRFWNDPENPIYGEQAGFDVPSVGAGLRLTPLETELVNLWLDGNGQAYLAQPPAQQEIGVEEQNPRGQANAAMGLGFNLTDNLTFGPTVRYDHVFYPKVEDLKVVSAGITFSIRFGGDKNPSQVAYYENGSVAVPEESESAPDEVKQEEILAEEDFTDGGNLCEELGFTLVMADDFKTVDRIAFDFDAASLRPDQQETMGRIVQCFKFYLTEHPETVVTIEGHCDERGSNEYNLALGFSRSQRIFEELVNGGVNSEQLKTISYGEERPIDPTHTETAWSKNRRSQFIGESKAQPQDVAAAPLPTNSTMVAADPATAVVVQETPKKVVPVVEIEENNDTTMLETYPGSLR